MHSTTSTASDALELLDDDGIVQLGGQFRKEMDCGHCCALNVTQGSADLVGPIDSFGFSGAGQPFGATPDEERQHDVIGEKSNKGLDTVFFSALNPDDSIAGTDEELELIEEGSVRHGSSFCVGNHRLARSRFRQV